MTRPDPAGTDPMWLDLEKITARALRRQHDVHVPQLEPRPELASRTSLVIHAALSTIDEASVDSLPSLARQELRLGMTGPLREAIAVADPGGAKVVDLRDQLLARLGGQAGATGALIVADRVHLSRLVRGVVPAVVAVGCVGWYGASRSTAHPHAALVASLLELGEEWLYQPTDRARLEQDMSDLAVSLVGDHPDDLLDAAV